MNVDTIRLNQKEYAQCGATNKNCLKIIPSENKDPQKLLQKFIVGDTTGTMFFGEFNKNGDLAFKSKHSGISKDVTKLELIMGNSVRDRVLTALGPHLKAFTKEGKDYFSFESNLTEPIRHMTIEDSKIWVAGNYIINLYEITKSSIEDKYAVILTDKINEMYVHSLDGENYNPILLCNDKSIKVLFEQETKYTYELNSIPVCIHPWSPTFTEVKKKKDMEKSMVVGLSNGSLVCLLFTPTHATEMWIKHPEKSPSSAIILLKTCEYLKDGIANIILARQNSTIEILKIGKNVTPQVIGSITLSEAITSIDYGYVSTNLYQEILVSTFSGKIIGLINEEIHLKYNPKAQTENPKELELKVASMKREIEDLKIEIENERALSGNTTGAFAEFNTFKSFINIAKSEQNNTFVLQIESQLPLEQVLLQSAIPMVIPDSHSKAIVCKCPEDLQNNSLVLINFIITEPNINRFEINMTLVEGKVGKVYCYLIPNAKVKTCQMLPVDIKPLALHERIHKIPAGIPFNTLILKGSYIKSQMLAWLNLIVSDIPPTTDEDIEINYHSLFVGSYLVCELKEGVTLFKSDLLSTLVIIKDIIMGEANKRNLSISINWDLEANSIKRIVEVLAPKFEECSKIDTSYKLIQALKEIENQEGNSDFLSEEFQNILINAEKITAEYKLQPQKLSYLKEVLVTLYIDFCKLRGIKTYNQNLEAFGKLLDKFSVYDILDFFVKISQNK